jgi:hypothetical protein
VTRTSFGCALAVILGAIALPAAAAPAADELTPEIEMVVEGAGEVLAVDQLCEWNLAPKVEAALRAGAKEMKMSAKLQQAIRARLVEIRNAKFGNLTPAGRVRTKAELCTAEQRAFLDKLIAQIAFD